MQTTPLGRTGANVSAMCLGTMLFGSRVDDRNTPLEESLTAFGRLVQAGKVRYLGASNHLAWRLAQAHAICEPRNLPAYGCIQQRYTYLHPVPGTNCAPQVLANEDLLDYCQATGLTLLAYSPLLGGAYDRPERMAAQPYITGRRLQVLQELAREKSVSCSQLVLAWMMHSTPAIIPVMAASNLQQMNDNLQSLNIRLQPDELQHLHLA